MVTYIGPNALRPLRPLLPPPPPATPTRKSTSSSGQLSVAGYSPRSTVSSPSSPFPLDLFNGGGQLLNSWPHHATLISVLKGRPLGWEVRNEVALALRNLVNSTSEEDIKLRESLVELIASESGGLIASTMENNACREFGCSREELEALLAMSDSRKDPYAPTLLVLKKLTSGLWAQLMDEIIPTVSAMLYPLEEAGVSGFRTRPLLIKHFRDKVLYPVLSNYCCTRADGRLLRHMLCEICTEKGDGSSAAYLRFEQMCFDLLQKATSGEEGGGEEVLVELDKASWSEEPITPARAGKAEVRRKFATSVEPSLSIHSMTSEEVDGSRDEINREGPSARVLEQEITTKKLLILAPNSTVIRRPTTLLRHPASASILLQPHFAPRQQEQRAEDQLDGNPLSSGHHFGLSSDEGERIRKPRSRTMPTKSVRWEDEEEEESQQPMRDI